jgi:glycosyltransferase involved in cell wall biosynthesis
MTSLAFISQPLGVIMLPIQSDSLGIWVYQVARRLVPEFPTTVYTKQVGEQAPTQQYEGVEYRRLPRFPDPWLTWLASGYAKRVPGSRPAFASPLYYAGYARRVARELKRGAIDIAFLFNFAQFLPVLAAASPATKLVLNMQCEWLTQLDREWVREHVKEAALILGCSDYITQKIARRFPELAERCGTVYNGVDVDHFVPGGDDEKRRDEPRILFVGRVSPEKGIHVILDAFHEIAAAFPKARLDIVGPDWVAPPEFIVNLSDDPEVSTLKEFYRTPASYRDQLQTRARKLGIAERVTFHGSARHGELLRHYHRASVLVNPSLSESFGMTLLEASACGVPVIASRVGGMPEIVQDGVTGWLVPGADAKQLAIVLHSALADPDRAQAMGRAARQRAVDVFSWRRVAESLLRHYGRIDPRVTDLAHRWATAGAGLAAS